MVYVRSDSICNACKLDLINGETKTLETGAFVKFVHPNYWPKHIELEQYLRNELVLVYTQYGMGFIKKCNLSRGHGD